MPAILTHYLFSQEVAPSMAGKSHCDDVYNWGSQGPDFLYFSPPIRRHWRTLAHIGTAMHEKNIERDFSFIATSCQELHGIRQKILESYYYGYLSHYILDSVFHPYVYGLQRYLKKKMPKASDNYIHRHIETNLDVLFLKHYKNMTIRDFSVISHFVRTPELNVVCQMYRRLFHTYFHTDFTPRAISHCFLSLKLVYSFFYSPRGFKRRAVTFAKRLTADSHPPIIALIHPVEPDTEIDYANLNKSIQEPGNTALHYTAFELFNLACEKYKAALPIAQKFCKEGGDFSAITKHINFEGISDN